MIAIDHQKTYTRVVDLVHLGEINTTGETGGLVRHTERTRIGTGTETETETETETGTETGTETETEIETEVEIEIEMAKNGGDL